MNILAISGSLRSASINTTVVRAAKLVAPAGVEIVLFEGLATLPHFNPDDEPGPESVARFRHQLVLSQGVLICSPEYAHGVPGTLKNALDWVVGSGEFVDKPVGLINASPRSTFAQASLMETLTIMTARLVPEACIPLPISGRKLYDAEIAADPALAGPLRRAIEALVGQGLETEPTCRRVN